MCPHSQISFRPVLVPLLVWSHVSNFHRWSVLTSHPRFHLPDDPTSVRLRDTTPNYFSSRYEISTKNLSSFTVSIIETWKFTQGEMVPLRTFLCLGLRIFQLTTELWGSKEFNYLFNRLPRPWIAIIYVPGTRYSARQMFAAVGEVSFSWPEATSISKVQSLFHE